MAGMKNHLIELQELDNEDEMPMKDENRHEHLMISEDKQLNIWLTDDGFIYFDFDKEQSEIFMSIEQVYKLASVLRANHWYTSVQKAGA